MENYCFVVVLILKVCNFICFVFSFFLGFVWLVYLVIFLCDVVDVVVILFRIMLNMNYFVIVFFWCGERIGCWCEMILFCGGIF